MNISASLSIQTSTVGGSINGSFIDSDKFKNSDLNFFVQVKVTNQSHVPKNLCCFNKIDKLPPKSFTDVYGVRDMPEKRLDGADYSLARIHIYQVLKREAS